MPSEATYRHVGMLPFDTFPLFGGRAEALIERAVEKGRGEYALDDVLERLESMEMLAFGEVVDFELRSIVVVRVIRYPRLSALHVAYGAGRGVARLLPAIKSFCHEQGITRIEVWCRASVARLFRQHGFDIGYCVPVLEI